MVPNLDLSALFDEALAQRVSEANKAKIAASYAQFPSDCDDDIDWVESYGVTPARAMAARRPWKGDD